MRKWENEKIGKSGNSKMGKLLNETKWENGEIGKLENEIIIKLKTWENEEH